MNQETPQNALNGATPANQPPISPRRALVVVLVILVVAVVAVLAGHHQRAVSAKALAERTTEAAAPTVIAFPAKPGAPVVNITLPGNVSAYTDSPIYARTSGYLKAWHYDIGAHVKKGALLAEIASPEIDQQLAQAEADLATAQANAANARTQSERYKGLVDSNAVSRQDTETLSNQAAATSSAVRSVQANVQRLRELQSFEKIYAPFDGVVTSRGVDIGQLITAGSGAELFHMQANQTLRVYVSVPLAYSKSAKKGDKIDLTFVELPNRVFQGTLVRTADSIDPVTRTLLTEIDVENRQGELLPGSLAQARFKMKQTVQSLVVPVTALIFRKEGLRVGMVVEGKNGPEARLSPVVIGEDDGATVQIISGISATDRVIQEPPDSLIDGQSVRLGESRKPAESGASNGKAPASAGHQPAGGGGK